MQGIWTFWIAMDQLGQALAYAPEDPGGLWIDKSIAAALNARDVPEMRRAFTAGLFNKPGVHGFSHGEEEKQDRGNLSSESEGSFG